MRLENIASALGGILNHSSDIDIGNVATLDDASHSDLSFLLDKKMLVNAKASDAGAIVVLEFIDDISCPQIKVAHPRKALVEAILLLADDPDDDIHMEAIHPSARISDSARVSPFARIGADVVIEDNVIIDANVVIGQSCRIGKETRIFPNVTLYRRTMVGNYCRLHSGCVIGSDGFGYVQIENKNMKIPHVGYVMIEDHVEVGANTSIDRGCLGKTVICNGSKIDNLCQIGHNAYVGEHVVITSQVGIVGSATIGDNVLIGGQSGIESVTIGNNVVIAARSGVTKNIESGCIVSGFPARNHKEELQERAFIRQLQKKSSIKRSN